MASQYKTRCPHCAAQFKITEEHLKQAGGAVRCGSCLQIFQANDNLVEAPAPEPAADNGDRWAGALDGSYTDSGEHDDGTAVADQGGYDDSLTLEDTEFSDSFMGLDENEADDSLGEDFSDMQGAGRSSHSEEADEAWAEALLQELEDNQPQAPERYPEPATKPAPVPQAAARPTPKAAPTPAADYNPFLDPEPEAAPAPRQPAAPAKPLQQPAKIKQQEPEQTDFTTAGRDHEDADDFNLFGADLFADDLFTNEPGLAEPASRPRPMRERDLPFQPRRDWAGLARWSGFSAFALVLLISQYAFFNFDSLARMPQWRPYYQQVCTLLGCELPGRSDVSRVRGANLVVRSHPDYRNTLIVDAILFNEANYPQPFPQLELSFTALDGKPVASRRFSPAEYLHGDLAGMTTMPRNTPLHVSLEIVDPGNRAVNYNLRLLANPDAADPI